MLLFAIPLLCLGGLVALVSGIWTLALAFQRHTYWGLAVLLFPVGSVAFACARWREARAPFCTGLFSLSLIGAALLAMPEGSVLRPLHQVLSIVQPNRAWKLSQAEEKMEAARQDADRELRLWTLKRQEDALLERKGALAWSDRAEAQALSLEIKHYNAEVQATLPREHGQRIVSR